MRRTFIILFALTLSLFALSACQSNPTGGNGDSPATAEGPAGADQTAEPASARAAESGEGQPLAEPVPEGRAVATFAGGCFWCMEPPFEKIDGVEAVLSGYTGGTEQRPTYDEVSYGKTSHTEAVRIIYDPQKVSYETLLDTFWRQIDPTDLEGQFVDRGSQYRPAIFYHTAEQKAAAEKSKAELDASGRFDEPVVVPIQPADDFWVAEDYHQDFYKKSPGRYKSYRSGSGRDAFIESHW